MCRYVEFPEGFSFPVTQVLSMWSLFAKYEGMDTEKEYHKFLAPTIVDKKYQARLFFNKSDNKLKKLEFNDMTFAVDVFDSCKNSRII